MLLRNVNKTTNLADTLVIFIILIINLYMALYPLWQGSSIWGEYSDIELFRRSFFPLIVVEVMLALVLFLRHSFVFNKTVGSLFLLSVLYVISSFFSGSSFNGAFRFLAVPVLYYIIVTIDTCRYYKLIVCIIVSIIIVWCIAPIIDYLFSPLDRKLLFFPHATNYENNGFGGYALHKNVYAFFAGIGVLCLLQLKGNRLIRILLIITLFVAIIISCSRSSLVALVIAIICNYILSKRGADKLHLKKKHIIVVLIIVSLSAFYFIREEFFVDKERLYIVAQFISVIKSNFLFGTGVTTVVDDGFAMSPAHNFILQSFADCGVFVTIAFLLFLFQMYKSGTRIFKVFMLYIVVIGLFQPYFALSLPNEYMMPCFLIPKFLNNEYTQEIGQTVSCEV